MEIIFTHDTYPLINNLRNLFSLLLDRYQSFGFVPFCGEKDVVIDSQTGNPCCSIDLLPDRYHIYLSNIAISGVEQMIWQFAHEMGHVYVGPYRDNWLVECFCHFFSYDALFYFKDIFRGHVSYTFTDYTQSQIRSLISLMQPVYRTSAAVDLAITNYISSNPTTYDRREDLQQLVGLMLHCNRAMIGRRFLQEIATNLSNFTDSSSPLNEVEEFTQPSIAGLNSRFNILVADFFKYTIDINRTLSLTI